MLANGKSLWPLSNQKLPSFSLPPNEFVSAVVDLSNLTSIANQLLTSKKLIKKKVDDLYEQILHKM